MNHTWKEGPLVYFGQVGWDTFSDCTVCGLGRPQGDAYALLERHPEHFSADCAVAQEQLRFFLLGWLRAAASIDKIRYGLGNSIIRAIEEKTATMYNVVQAFKMLEKACPWPEDLEVELQGGRPAPQWPLLDVEL